MLKAVLETVCTEGDVDTVIIERIETYMSLERWSISHWAEQVFNPNEKQDRGTLVSNWSKQAFHSNGERYEGIIKELIQAPVDVQKNLGKAVVIVLPVEEEGIDTIEFEVSRRNSRDYYLSEGIPVYLTLERAAKALSNLVGYYERRDVTLSSDSSD